MIVSRHRHMAAASDELARTATLLEDLVQAGDAGDEQVVPTPCGHELLVDGQKPGGVRRSP